MKYDPALCPICKEPAASVLESLLADVLLQHDAETGEYDHEGESKVWWETSEHVTADGPKGQSAKEAGGIAYQVEPDEGEPDLHLLKCPEGHEWAAELVD